MMELHYYIASEREKEIAPKPIIEAEIAGL